MSKIVSAKDRDLIKRISDLTKLITRAYQNMFFEEMENGTNTNHYNFLLEELLKLKEEEAILYDKLELTPEKANRLIEYLMLTRQLPMREKNNVLNSFYGIDSKPFYIYRILNKLENFCKNNDDKFQDWLIVNSIFPNKEEAKEYILYLKLFSALNDDFEKSFMYFNELTLKNTDSVASKETLSKVKYNLCTISENIEYEFINNHFLEKDSIYFSFPFIAEMNRINEKSIKNFQINCSGEYCAKAIENLLCPNQSIDDIFMIEKDFFSSYLKAGLSLIYPLDEYDIMLDAINNSLQRALEASNGNSSKSVDLIFDSFDNLTEVRSKYKYLHIIPPK